MTAMLARGPAAEAASPRPTMMGAAAREQAQLKRLSFCAGSVRVQVRVRARVETHVYGGVRFRVRVRLPGRRRVSSIGANLEDHGARNDSRS